MITQILPLTRTSYLKISVTLIKGFMFFSFFHSKIDGHSSQHINLLMENLKFSLSLSDWQLMTGLYEYLYIPFDRSRTEDNPLPPPKKKLFWFVYRVNFRKCACSLLARCPDKYWYQAILQHQINQPKTCITITGCIVNFTFHLLPCIYIYDIVHTLSTRSRTFVLLLDWLMKSPLLNKSTRHFIPTMQHTMIFRTFYIFYTGISYM